MYVIKIKNNIPEIKTSSISLVNTATPFQHIFYLMRKNEKDVVQPQRVPAMAFSNSLAAIFTPWAA
jgi:hypothetical protein